MGYRVEGALWNSVFAVPGALVDEHLKLCGGAALKVLLFVLRKSGDASPQQISAFLGLPVADVLDALNYWIHLGVLSEISAEKNSDGQGLRSTADFSEREQLPEKAAPQPRTYELDSFRQKSAPTDNSQPKKASAQEEAAGPRPSAHKPGSFRQKLTPKQINQMSREDGSIALLLQESQMVLGKPITPVATDTITALYSYYGMKPEVILMLLQYCISQGKDNMRYIETVAAGWIESGIDTHEKAEREIVKAFEREKLENVIRRLFGIHDRALIASERKYISAWKEQGISVELIGLAYERTIEQKGKLSFAYINGILQNWQAKGISTTGQAMEEMRGKKTPPAPSKSAAPDEMEQIYKYGDI